jgi:DNA-binding GntR family transcriptional regulator
MFDRTPWSLASANTTPLPPSPAPRTEVALQRVHHAIVSCELAPGLMIHEATLAERFRLGRAAVRVALTRLEAIGFVQRQARQGWRVTPLDGTHVTALILARRKLEPALAHRLLSAEEVQVLRPLAAAIGAAAGRLEPAVVATARAAERRIRDVLAEPSGALARRWFSELADHVSRIVRALESAGQPWTPADLGPLIEALASGDAISAEQLIRAEIDGFESAVARAMLTFSPQVNPAMRRRGRRPLAPKPMAVAPATKRKEE